MSNLSNEVQAKVAQLIDQGTVHTNNEQHLEALRCFFQALDLFPEPLEARSETLWLLAAIGDSWFLLGNYENSIGALSDAIRCGGLGNPFIHLRLGQSQYEIGNQDKAADELVRAFMGAGAEIFEDEPAKYFQFLKTKINMPGEENER